MVYCKKPTTIAELEDIIPAILAHISPILLQNTLKEFFKRLGPCQSVEGFRPLNLDFGFDI